MTSHDDRVNQLREKNLTDPKMHATALFNIEESTMRGEHKFGELCAKLESYFTQRKTADKAFLDQAQRLSILLNHVRFLLVVIAVILLAYALK